jgi:hypothetical protein
MTKIVREVRKRGVFGWIFLILFYGVNLYFGYALIRGLAAVAPSINDPNASQAEQAGTSIGLMIGFGSILAMWGFCAVITGLLAMVTRGKRILIEDETPTAKQSKSGWGTAGASVLAVLAIIVGFVGVSAVVGTKPPASTPTYVDYKPGAGFRQAKEDVADTGPKLRVKNWGCSNAHGYSTVEGEVENISNAKMENVEAVAKYYTKSDEFVTSDSTLVEYDPLLAGQTTPFKVLTRHNPSAH